MHGGQILHFVSLLFFGFVHQCEMIQSFYDIVKVLFFSSYGQHFEIISVPTGRNIVKSIKETKFTRGKLKSVSQITHPFGLFNLLAPQTSACVLVLVWPQLHFFLLIDNFLFSFTTLSNFV